MSDPYKISKRQRITPSTEAGVIDLDQSRFCVGGQTRPGSLYIETTNPSELAQLLAKPEDSLPENVCKGSRVIPAHAVSAEHSPKGSRNYEFFGSDGESYELFAAACKERAASLIEWSEHDGAIGGSAGVQREVAFGIDGDYFDLGRVIMGDPECWAKPTGEGDRAKGFVQLLVPFAAAGGARAESIKAKARAIIAATDYLETNGVRVRVTVPITQVGCLIVAQVKDYAQPFDAGALAVTLHPSFKRRVAFRACELGGSTSGYGNPDRNLELCRRITDQAPELFGLDDAPVAWIEDPYGTWGEAETAALLADAERIAREADQKEF